MNHGIGREVTTRAEARALVTDLFEPLEAHFSPGRARVKPGEPGAHFPNAAAELEGFARPLWGLAPLAAGVVAGGGAAGGAAGTDEGFDGWSLYREGLRNGTDPDHPEYWGPADDYSQKHVELAAIGVGLALAPEELWDPLDAETREHLVAYLNRVNDAALHEGNWLFFRVLVNAGLRSVGAEHDWERTQETLDRLENYYLDEGWYTDGPHDENPCDHYIAWAMHVYGLLYATIAGDDDPERADRFRERAREFATEYREWFHPDGPGLPYGRSLTYRMAQASFWGALALAGVEALPWGEIRGLWARNVRWWIDQPVFTSDGVLSVGYRYPNLKMSEAYNSPSSPYWAMKAFLPLALSEDHPFWTAEEEPIGTTDGVVVQEQPKMALCRDDEADHHYALTAGQNSRYGEKYTKFAYSTDFGFSVRSRAPGLGGAGHDGALALRAEGEDFRTRLSVADATVADGLLYSRWEPWPDVSLDTWLVPASPWHVRAHRLETGRALDSGEGGFPMDRRGDDDPDAFEHGTAEGRSVVRYPAGTSGVRDLRARRTGRAVDQDPNTNLNAPRTVVPTLSGRHDPGTHWLVTAVTAATAEGDAAWNRSPTLDTEDGTPVLRDGAGTVIRRFDGTGPGPLEDFPTGG